MLCKSRRVKVIHRVVCCVYLTTDVSAIRNRSSRRSKPKAVFPVSRAEPDGIEIVLRVKMFPTTASVAYRRAAICYTVVPIDAGQLSGDGR